MELCSAQQETFKYFRFELVLLKYGFCKKYFDRNEPLTSWTLLSSVFSRSWSVVHFYQSNFLQNPYFRIYQLTHISANFISTVVARAISKFSKIHTFLICRMQKMGKKILVHHWTWLIIWKWHFLSKFCQISTFRSGNQYERLTQFITMPVPKIVVVTR